MTNPREALHRALRYFKHYEENQRGCIDAMRRDIPEAIEAMIDARIKLALEKEKTNENNQADKQGDQLR